MIQLDTIRTKIDALLPDLIRTRHHLHAHPELALSEFNTQVYLREQLEPLDVTILPPALGTDVIAELKGSSPGPHIVLRADMDALPIAEPAGAPYRSTRDGLMHACGHDGHMTMLLGAAKVLNSLKNELAGSVRFVFQPGEEIIGAGKDLIASGILDDPKPDLVLAMHNMPGYPEGTFCSKPGSFMAAADFFKLTIKGRGGHGSAPETCVDPIYASSRILNHLYQIPSRYFSALDSLVISPCMINGGTNANVIPDSVYLEGTVRYLSKEVGKRIPEVFESVVRNECDAVGTTYELDYSRPYMPTINDQKAFGYGKTLVQAVFGDDRWVDLESPLMSSEDFSFYLDRYPGAMIFIGNGLQCASLHNPSYDFNDDIIRDGVLFFVSAVLMLEKAHAGGS